MADCLGQLAGDLALSGGVLDLVAAEAFEQAGHIDLLVVLGKVLKDLLALGVSDRDVDAFEALLEDSVAHRRLSRPLLHAIEQVLRA